MWIRLITDDSEYDQQIREICRSLLPSSRIENTVGPDVSECTVPARPKMYGLVIQDVRGSRVRATTEQNSGNAFAVVRAVCQNNASEAVERTVSREELILWLRDFSAMTTETSIVEDVVVQSPHVRLSHLLLPTRTDLIPVLRDRLMRSIRDFHVVEGSRENHFCLALEEALNNAFFHGNLEISSQLKEDGSSRFIELAREREQIEPWKSRRIRVTELVSMFGLWISIQDDGAGFDVAAALERCNDPEALLASGRGLLMMRAFADEVFFNRAGNEVTLVLYAENKDRELPLGIHEGDVTRGVFRGVG